jgi:hypothetical protein
MSNSKISALTSATTPLAGTEVLPIVQSGATVNATVANITGAGTYPGSFTTLDSSGNTTLGDTTTDTVKVNGYMGVGVAAAPSISVYASSTALTTTNQRGFQSSVFGTSAATVKIAGYWSNIGTAATAFTCTDVINFYALNAIKGAGSTITNLHGLYIENQTQGTNNYGITSLVSSGTNKWNVYASGTAQNYFEGSMGIGAMLPVGKLDVFASSGGGAGTVVPVSITVGDTSSGNAWPGDGTLSTVFNYFSGDGTNNGVRFRHGVGETNTSGSTSVWKIQYRAAGGAINSYTGFSNALTVDTSGNVLVTGVGGLGYGTGSGGTVTQVTSRTTGVTLNKTNGAITLVSGAGLATFQSFTVTNSTVAATDVVHVTQKSGTDLYQIFVTATAAGSFRITFATTGGITVEQPVFNFAVIKGVTA